MQQLLHSIIILLYKYTPAISVCGSPVDVDRRTWSSAPRQTRAAAAGRWSASMVVECVGGRGAVNKSMARGAPSQELYSRSTNCTRTRTHTPNFGRVREFWSGYRSAGWQSTMERGARHRVNFLPRPPRCARSQAPARGPRSTTVFFGNELPAVAPGRRCGGAVLQKRSN